MRVTLVALALLIAGCGGDDAPEFVAELADDSGSIELVETVPTTVATTTTASTTTTIAPLVVRYTHPSTLAAALQRASKERMGRNAYATDIQMFTKSFHAMEREQQTAAYEGRSYYDLEPYSQALAWLEQNRPSEIRAYEYAKAAKNFSDVMEEMEEDQEDMFGRDEGKDESPW